jgi:DNA-binding CsgD family transcriptional regulator
MAVSGAGGIDWCAYAECLRRADPGPWSGLFTPAEARVAACLLTGRMTNKEIADELEIACSRVHDCLLQIFKKLGVHRRGEARLGLCRGT